MDSIHLKQLLEKSQALLDGHFLLTSGLHSDRYIEKFRVLEDPNALDQVCQAMAQVYSDQNVELVLGAAVGGILLAGGVGRHLGVRHIFTERVDGEMALRRGFYIDPGTRVLIVEDVITTGGSVRELIDICRKHSAEVVGVVNLVDRNENPLSFGVPTQTLLQLPVQSWTAEECPLCQQDIPFTSRGRSGKA